MHKYDIKLKALIDFTARDLYNWCIIIIDPL